MLLPFSAALALLSPAGPPANLPNSPQAVEAFEGIPNVTVNWYDVDGRNARQVRRAMNELRPTDMNDERRVDGLTQWRYRWRVRRNASGICRVMEVDLEFSAEVTLPRLVGERAPQDLQERFAAYLATLIEHEEGHLRPAWEGRYFILTALNGSDCEGMSEAGRNAIRTLNAADVEYDRRTQHGRTTIVSFQ